MKVGFIAIIFKSIVHLVFKGKLGMPGAKKGGGAGPSTPSKGVTYDAMGTKWNKAMWDNMESKCLILALGGFPMKIRIKVTHHINMQLSCMKL